MCPCPGLGLQPTWTGPQLCGGVRAVAMQQLFYLPEASSGVRSGSALSWGAGADLVSPDGGVRGAQQNSTKKYKARPRLLVVSVPQLWGLTSPCPVLVYKLAGSLLPVSLGLIWSWPQFWCEYGGRERSNDNKTNQQTPSRAIIALQDLNLPPTVNCFRLATGRDPRMSQQGPERENESRAVLLGLRCGPAPWTSPVAAVAVGLAQFIPWAPVLTTRHHEGQGLVGRSEPVLAGASRTPWEKCLQFMTGQDTLFSPLQWLS